MDVGLGLLALVLRLTDPQQTRFEETITVLPDQRSLERPAAVTTLGREVLEMAPALSLDDVLRSVPGFSLFRRSSSRVANPTTQGVTLRGAAASGASRALVLADGVPINDPVGGWVYWNAIPTVAVHEVSVQRGAAGDLHGADALAGVVVVTRAQDGVARVLAEGGQQGTARLSAYAGSGRFAASAERFTTDGFVVVAPEARGAIDVPASSRHTSLDGSVRGAPVAVKMTARASAFVEDRGNGTPFQRNRTRLAHGSVEAARWQPGSAWGWSARTHGAAQRYRQTFSAVPAPRTSERPTSEQDVSAAAAGASFDVAGATGRTRTFASASFQHVDANLEDVELSPAGALPANIVEPSQDSLSVAGQASYRFDRLSIGAGLRAGRWSSRLAASNAHLFVTPRVWATQSIGRVSWNIAWQSGFRGPTLNELYRPFRVGNVLTQANASLSPERARGIEAGVSARTRRVTARLVGFASRIEDAIVNVTLNTQEGTILRQRRNAARIRAAGVELEIEVPATRAIEFTASASRIGSEFSAGTLQGLRVPQVPRVHLAVGGRLRKGPLRLAGEWRHYGEQFDDDRNAFALAPESTLDIRAGWQFGRFEGFAAVENVTDEEQEVGKTPLRTLGVPRTARAGVRVRFR